ncbi:hypothetical protein [Pseudomonas psychrophila]|uniref:hypothetical protein n=1 Tax=Pseudomonas psychrophila TaxID=122355 RepID=UPI0039B44D8B
MAGDSTWASAAAFFVLINLINLTNVKVFGEAEFWFAIIKVVAIVGMIALGSYLLVSGSGGPQASVSNLWEHGGFFPNGTTGLIMAMALYHVLLRRSGNARFHRSRSRQTTHRDPQGDQSGDLPQS